MANLWLFYGYSMAILWLFNEKKYASVSEIGGEKNALRVYFTTEKKDDKLGENGTMQYNTIQYDFIKHDNIIQ